MSSKSCAVPGSAPLLRKTGRHFLIVQNKWTDLEKEYCPACSESWIVVGCSEWLLGAGISWDAFPSSKSSLPLSLTSGLVSSWATHHVNQPGKTSCFPSHAPLQVEGGSVADLGILVPLEQPLSKQCLESPAMPRQWEQSLDLETMAEDSGQHHPHPSVSCSLTGPISSSVLS